MRQLILFAVLLFSVGISSHAQDFYQIQNRWKSNEFIHAEQPQPAVGSIQPGWWSAQWIIVDVDGSGYYQIKNRWKNEFLHIQNGALECSSIQPGWWSAQWALEPVEGSSFVRLRNRWKQETAIHNQNGRLEAGSIDLGWWSAQWQLIKVGEPQPVAVEQPVAMPTVVHQEVSPRNNLNPSAFVPEHGGVVTQISVRYTDQLSLPDNIQVGNQIYFFPQEVIISNTAGLSFDPKNLPIGGQTFTVTEINPKVKLDRPMPMMRNRDNESFSLVVEIF
ncbi:MAG: RICIN domain-containing protein [Cyclobacteriaceae bacterium]|nr:RICIN domain-containing protein [Cyclobacteriaceae bacterium]